MAKEAKGKILDIGFADLPNRYLTGDITGFDIREVPKPVSYKLTITGDVENIRDTVRDKFDTIIAGEIVEHLENPIKFLKDCRELLNVNGILIISVPNPYYPPEIVFNWIMDRRHMYCKDHLFAYPPRWMVRLLTYTGYGIKKILSGGITLSSRITIPAPLFICHHVIYVARRVE